MINICSSLRKHNKQLFINDYIQTIVNLSIDRNNIIKFIASFMIHKNNFFDEDILNIIIKIRNGLLYIILISLIQIILQRQLDK